MVDLVRELTTVRMKAKQCIAYKCEVQQRAVPLDAANCRMTPQETPPRSPQ